jgi:AcrR family transcriptional regulator
VSVAGSVRDRRRAETVREIKDATLRQLGDAGPGGMSLRGVARSLGMTVQSLYHYFDSREALLTELVADAHHALADAVQAAADAARARPPVERRLAATQAFRVWALANRSAFLLLYGTPVPGFEPLAEGGTGPAARRLAGPFVEVVFAGWTPDEIAAVPPPAGEEPLPGPRDTGIPLPPGALVLLVELRARMHGLVMLELLGHLHPLQAHGPAVFAGAMRRMSEDVDTLQGRVQAFLADR